MHVRNEEAAAFAAGAEVHISGQRAVCASSCGPGNLHLINGLYDCQRSRVPVLAIAAQIPSSEMGTAYFQETHPEELFKDCSDYTAVITDSHSQCQSLLVFVQFTQHVLGRNELGGYSVGCRGRKAML